MIAVHVGAGYHSQTKISAYKTLCENSCQAALESIREGSSALEAVKVAISLLEDCPLTNAGTGSNLDLNGTVECDACIMTGDLQFGACGAVQGVKNPINLAGNILENQWRKQALGRVAPCVLVGDGAQKWALDQGIETCDPKDLKTPTQCLAYNKYMKHLKTAQDKEKRASLVDVNSANGEGDVVSDTVGAVCVDLDGDVASGASSGGILLKNPGRLGPAAMYGCCCWTETSSNGKVAIASTGCGEQLMRTLLVRDCARDVLKDSSNPLCSSVQESFSRFLNCDHLKGDKNAGLLVLHCDDSGGHELVWTHSTYSMILGYASISAKKPVSVLSTNSGPLGKSNVLSGKVFSKKV